MAPGLARSGDDRRPPDLLVDELMGMISGAIGPQPKLPHEVHFGNQPRVIQCQLLTGRKMRRAIAMSSNPHAWKTGLRLHFLQVGYLAPDRLFPADIPGVAAEHLAKIVGQRERSDRSANEASSSAWAADPLVDKRIAGEEPAVRRRTTT
jgi:hypothetical protein